MFSRAKKPSMAIDIAPLIDVVFLLLIFFMLSSNFVLPSIPLDLPKTGGAQVDGNEPVKVAMTKDGILAINGDVVSDGEFDAKLRQVLGLHANKTVSFEGDQQALLGNFVDLLNRAQQCGAVKINIVHQTP